MHKFCRPLICYTKRCKMLTFWPKNSYQMTFTGFEFHDEQGTSKTKSSDVFLAICSTSALTYAFYKIYSTNFNGKKVGAHAAEISSEDSNKDGCDVKSVRHAVNFIADIAEKVAPSVVFIEAAGVTRTAFGLAEYNSLGAGFVVRGDGLILTNAHVVQGFKSLIVTLHDGSKYDGVVEHYDSSTDLATIRIKAKNLPVIKLAHSKNARPGEFVIAMGSPLSFSNSVTHGVISNTQRRINANMHGDPRRKSNMHYIQTDAPITFGNSGGPLINMDGEAVGINNMSVNGTAGISFAIPSEYAIRFLETVEKESKKSSSTFLPLFKRKRLGITMLTLDPDVIFELRFWNSQFPNIDHGILIHTVEQRSVAQKAGMRPGDIITHINKEPIYNGEGLEEKLQTANTFTITVLRDGRVENLLIEF